MPDFSKYDRDPDALAWARAKVQAEIDRARNFDEQVRAAHDPDVDQDGTQTDNNQFKPGDIVRRERFNLADWVYYGSANVPRTEGDETVYEEWAVISPSGSNNHALLLVRASQLTKVGPFFEEGKTYRHINGNRFHVKTVRGSSVKDTLTAFGLHTRLNEETDIGDCRESWVCRYDFDGWKEIPDA